MLQILNRFICVHSAFWQHDRWYRLAWMIGPQAAALTGIILLLAPGSASAPPAAPWAKAPAADQHPDFATCGRSTATSAQRLEACNRMLAAGGLSPPQLAQLLFNRGWLLETSGQKDQALLDYSQALTHNPTDLGSLINRGRIHAAKNDFAAAKADFDRAAQAHPGSAFPIGNRAEVLAKQGKLEEALAEAVKASQIDSKSSYASSLQTSIRAQIAQARTKAAPSAQGTRADPDFQLCSNNEADVRQRGGACDRLIASGKLTGGDLAVAYFGRGWMREKAGDAASAITDYSEAVRHDPSHFWAQNNLGGVRLVRNDAIGARAAFEAAIAINAQIANPHLGRAQALKQLGQPREALIDVDKAIAIKPDWSQAKEVRTAILADIDRNPAQRPVARPSPDQQGTPTPLVKDGHSNSPARQEAEKLRRQAREKFGLKDWSGVITDMSRVVESGVAVAGDYELRGGAYRSKGLKDEALKDLSQAISMPGHTWYARLHRGLILAERGRVEDGLADLDAGLKDYKDPDPRLYLERGRLRFERQDLERASIDFSQYISQMPNDAQGYLWRGRTDLNANIAQLASCREAARTPSDFARPICERDNRFDPAISDLQAALQRNAQLFEAQFQLGRAYGQLGRQADAIAAYTATIRINPSLSEPYNNRGVSYLTQKKLELALADFTEAIRLNDRNAHAYANRGEMHESAGRRQLAVGDFRRALDLDGKNQKALDGLRRLGQRR